MDRPEKSGRKASLIEVPAMGMTAIPNDKVGVMPKRTEQEDQSRLIHGSRTVPRSQVDAVVEQCE